MKIKQIAAIFLLLVAGWLFAQGWMGERGLTQVRQLAKQYYQRVTETNSIQEKNKALQKDIKRLKGDKAWVEKQVREKLGWVKKSEVIYKFETVEKNGNTQ